MLQEGETILFECACSSREHQFIVSKVDDMIYASPYLAVLPFRKRLRAALKYIFGYHYCCYGHFEEMIFRKEDAGTLGEVVTWLNGLEKENCPK
jgi:hypothetical protein